MTPSKKTINKLLRAMGKDTLDAYEGEHPVQYAIILLAEKILELEREIETLRSETLG